MRRVWAGLVTATVMFGCASTPKFDYYTLDMTRSGRTEPNTVIAVEPLATAEELGGDRIFIQASPTRVEYFATDRWVAGVGELVQRKLAVELGSGGPGAPGMRLSGTVLACGQVDTAAGRSAHVKLAIALEDRQVARSHPPLLEKTYEERCEVTGEGTEALAKAISRCVEAIATEIAADGDAIGLPEGEAPVQGAGD